jgi:uncharacterized membrane protein HdeD (DUF308 family)
VLTGIVEIVAAVKLRKLITGEWAMILAGLLSVAFGILLISSPIVGMIAVTWWIGAYALVLGIMFLSLAFRLRGVQRQVRGA